MSSFSALTLVAGNQIYAKAYATNSIGSGIISDISIGNVVYQTAPTASPTGLTASATTSQISLSWNDLYGNQNIGFSSIKNYVIYWDEGTLPGLTSVLNVTGLSYTISSGIVVNGTYKF